MFDLVSAYHRNRNRSSSCFRRRELVAVLMLVSLAACSSGSEEEKDQDPVETPPASPIDDEEIPGISRSGGNEGADTTDDPDRLIRQLDQVIHETDAYILRTGVGADAALSSRPLDALENRIRSVRDELKESPVRE